MAEQFSWVPLPYGSLPGHLFPLKSLALSARVSSDNSFPSVRQEPSFGPWKGSAFLQHYDMEDPCQEMYLVSVDQGELLLAGGGLEVWDVGPGW